VVANALAVPITGFWIMPWALVACTLMPFGLEGIALPPMGWGIDAVAAIARTVTSWPGAALTLPSMSAEALILLSLGGLWLCIWQRRWRWLGLMPIATHGGKINQATWTRRAAAEVGAPWPAAGSSADGALSCDAMGCLYRARGRTVALIRDGAALAEDCRSTDLVVSPIPARRFCRGPRIIDRIDVWKNGAYAIWLDADEIRVESVRDWRGTRPWSGLPERARE